MVRAPCCEKMGLKKGPWTPEEDQILVSYIQKNGHGNWRALPKQAGLLRCGKSCRLRWTNYLRPDIKRGNFSKEEEEAIIKLHEMLGNRWSAIAARLPGRTDNEIKNVWHTHLKKKLKNYQTSQDLTKNHSTVIMPKSDLIDQQDVTSPSCAPASPQRSTSEMSSVTDGSAVTGAITDQTGIKQEETESSEYFPQIDESFWSDELSTDNSTSNMESNFSGISAEELQYQFMGSSVEQEMNVYSSSKLEDDMDFWYNVFIKAGDLPELPEF